MHMYVHVVGCYVHVCVYMIKVRMCIYICINAFYGVGMYACMHVIIYACVCLSVCTHACLYGCTNVGVYINV